MSARSMSEVRRKLSELNARYAPEGVDFQLHESRHLVPYASFSEATGHFSTGVRRVTDYTLVIQGTPSGVAPAIPCTAVLAEQAGTGIPLYPNPYPAQQAVTGIPLYPHPA